MGNERWDETWHRLREWTNGQGPAERLAAQILFHDHYENVDPSHPLGGPDGGKDLVCAKHGVQYVVAVYFARGEQGFLDIRRKFDADRENARGSCVAGFIFVTNQELRLAERRDLSGDLNDGEIYHLERTSAILDDPRMHSVRRQFLGIESRDGAGGTGGSGRIIGNRGVVIGGRGGYGGIGGPGGGGGLVQEDPALAERNLLKEHRYQQVSAELLVRHGATVATATLAAGIAAACYRTAQATAGEGRLAEEIDAVFSRLPELAGTR